MLGWCIPWIALKATPSLDALNVDDASLQPDIFDSRYWNSLDFKQIDILEHTSPKIELLIQKV
jgi:hypothetical protein